MVFLCKKIYIASFTFAVMFLNVNFQFNVHQLIKHVTDRQAFRGVGYEERLNAAASNSTMSGAFLTPEHTDFDFSSDVSLLPVLTCIKDIGNLPSQKDADLEAGCQNGSNCDSGPEMNSTELGVKNSVLVSPRYTLKTRSFKSK